MGGADTCELLAELPAGEWMSQPRLHHYVPRFYLKRFADPAGRIWAWNKQNDSAFETRAERLAAQRDFYRQEWLVAHGHDPMTLEKQFADLEGQVATITGQWLEWLRVAELGEAIWIPAPNREVVALFLALQHLRTADYRDIMAAYVAEYGHREFGEAELTEAHTDLLWKEDFFRPIQARLQNCIWLFARNASDRPFVTSDNPVAFKTGDNRQWVKAGVMGKEVYAVYPMAPDIILFCHPPEGRFAELERFDGTLSPVAMTEELVQVENHGQVFGALRFVLSCENQFDFAREFAPTIGTDLYAPPGPTAQGPDG